MIANQAMKYALPGAFASLAACACLSNGAPPMVRLENRVIANRPNDVLAQARRALEEQCRAVESAEPPETAKAARNRLVTAYMFGVDLAYNEYERNLLDAGREHDLAASIASLGRSTIGSVVGEEALAEALSTANASVTGAHAGIDRDYLLNQALAILPTQMRANRAAQRALLLRHMPLAYGDWTSCAALSDVLAYEQAGTPTPPWRRSRP